MTDHLLFAGSADESGDGLLRLMFFIAGPALAVMLAYLFYTGLFCSDDTRYMAGVLKMAQGVSIDLSSNAERRLVFLLPAFLLYISNAGDLDAAIAVYALAYVALPILAWGILRVHGIFVAATGAVLCALVPLLYRFSGAMLPDALSAMLCGILLLLSLKWDRARRMGEGRSLSAFGMGAVAMLAISVKESNAVISVIPFVMVGIQFLRNFRSKDSFSPGIWMAVGVISFLLLEACLYRVFAGQWHVGLMNSASSHDFTRFIEIQGLYPHERLWTLIMMLDVATASVFGLALVAALYLLAAPATGWYRGRSAEWLLPAVFFVWPLFYFSIGSASFSDYIPPVMQERYFAPCVLPAAVLILLAGARVLHRRGAAMKVAPALLVCGALAAAIPLEMEMRGTMYWARSKDSFVVALEDLKRRAPDIALHHVRAEANSEITRCRDLLIDHKWGRGKVLQSEVRPPFAMVGIQKEQLAGLDGPVGKLVRDNLANGRWSIGILGYYYADEKADNDRWWLPREDAVLQSSEHEPGRFRESNYPKGHVPWMKREMHTELFLITENEGVDGQR